MAYTIIEPQSGMMPIASTDAGATAPNGATVYPTSPMFPGMIVRAKDPTYGVGEFVFLKGVASTVVGSVVTYNATTFQTALAAVGTNKPQPVAFAMAATTAALWGWYQIGGLAVAAKTSGLALASNAAIGVLTVGKIAATGTGKEVQGALTAAKATTPTTVQLVIDRPAMQGRTT